MADDLQALLDKIDREGIQKGEDKAQEIIAKAKAEAEAIISKAKADAESLRKSAEAENATLREKTNLAMRQASREVLLDLRSQLEKRVRAVVSELLKSTLTPQTLGSIISTLCENYAKEASNNGNLEVLLAAEQLDAIRDIVYAKLAGNLKAQPSFAPNRFLASGFKLNFKDRDVLYDFSDEALSEAITAHLSPALATLLTSGK